MTPRLSIIIPIHNMQNGAYFLWRAIQSIMAQSFKDYEIIITQEGKMAENTNAGIKKCRGDIVKILFMDDYLAHEQVLQDIVTAFDNVNTNWLIIGCDTNPTPQWTDDLETGNNKLGSPSALAFRNETPLFFDERMSWMLDCDLYKRLYARYGLPTILEQIGVYMGIGEHQMTRILTNEEKLAEHKLIEEKYV